MIDTRPEIYHRPDDARIREAMMVVFNVIECIGPEVNIQGDALLRFVLAKDSTLAQAMWAVHELTVRGGFETAQWQDRNRKRKSIYTASTPPAGVEMASGDIHIVGSPNWYELAFTPSHDRLFALRNEMLGHSTTLTDKHDTTTDNPESKPKYRRLMSREAADCARLYKKARKIDSGTRMKHVVAEYVEKHGGSAQTIMRVLNDNPDQWK